MARRLLILALVLLALLGISQLVIPPILEHRLSDRLTAGGGSADVSLSAFPAARLLFNDGSRITVTGHDLDLTAESESGDVFSNLDGYDRVSISLDDLRAGPFDLATFELTRAGSAAPYHLVTRGQTSPVDLASFGTSQLGLPGGPLLNFLGSEVTPQRDIPIHLDMDLESDAGRIVVTSGTGKIGGVPTGPLAELVTSLVVVQF